MKLIIFILMITNVAIAAQGSPKLELSLLQTYQKEMTFLLAQKRSLKKQISQLGSEYNKKLKEADKKISQLEDSLVQKTAENEKMINQLSDAEKSLEQSEMNKSLVETTITQSKMTLGMDNKILESINTKEGKLSIIFHKGMNILKDGSKFRTSAGEYYLNDGTKVKGEVTTYGHVARYGTHGGKTYMLLPVGANNFKVYDDEKHTLTNLQGNSALPAFLYESSEKAIEIKKEQSFFEMVHAGGSIAWVIVVLGAFAFILMSIRMVLLYFAGKVDKSLIKDLEIGNVTDIKTKIEKSNSSFSRVLGKTYDSLNKDLDERENVIQESILGELNFLDRFGAVILVMAAVAPLLGLLGTVTGMISTFDIITEFGTGDPKLLSSGISEALITTKLGLMVAIPTLLMGNLLGGWSNKIKIMLEREALRLSNLVQPGEESHV
jgi:biopolymer transport protein ExbB